MLASRSSRILRRQTRGQSQRTCPGRSLRAERITPHPKSPSPQESQLGRTIRYIGCAHLRRTLLMLPIIDHVEASTHDTLRAYQFLSGFEPSLSSAEFHWDLKVDHLSELQLFLAIPNTQGSRMPVVENAQLHHSQAMFNL